SGERQAGAGAPGLSEVVDAVGSERPTGEAAVAVVPDSPATGLALDAASDGSPDRLVIHRAPEPATESAVVEPLQMAPGIDPQVPTEPAALEPAQPPVPLAPADDRRLTSPGIRLDQVKEELVAWVKTLMSAAVYAVLIVTFGFQVARVEGQSMAPTLEDQDRLIVNKLVYRISEPRRSDIVMMYYPLNPDKSFVKRVIAEEGDTVRIVDGRVYVNDIPLKDDYVASEYRSHDD